VKLGFDCGRKNIHHAVLKNGVVIETGSIPHNGNIPETFVNLYGLITEKFTEEEIESIGITGQLELPGHRVFDSIVATIEANKFLLTGCQTLLSIGCESFYLVLTDENYNYVEHIINTDCASGTGSFIDQQAERLGLSTESIEEMAYNFVGKTPPIASRCAVFAKSDIIHAGAQGFGKEAIAAGICEGVTSSILENVVKGRDLPAPILILGGTAKNRKIIAVLAEKLAKKVIISPYSQTFNAIGSALLGTESVFSFSDIFKKMKNTREVRQSLQTNLTHYPDFNQDNSYVENQVEITCYDSLKKDSYQVFLGIDIGSTSTKMAVTSSDLEILTSLYTRTKGDPISAVSRLLEQFSKIFAHTAFTIKGVCTTGSGRSLVCDVISADASLNEISAHAYGAVFLDPLVDTIIEIGGQDSKFTRLKDGEITNSAMNYVCAAGTGSFIEEQAIRLGISLAEINDLAINATAPFTSDRCTVYMERDLNTLSTEGFTKSQIIAAVLFSVRDNYLSRVVGKIPIGKRIFFQGATAKNRALVAAFEQGLNQPIHVSRYCHLTGAIGASLYAKKLNLKDSAFKSANFTFKQEIEICDLCVNHCHMNVFTTAQKKTAWGLKCGKDYESKTVARQTTVSELEKAYSKIFDGRTTGTANGLVIGIPSALYMEDYYPLFRLFFARLGARTIIQKSSAATSKEGKNLVNAEFCAPISGVHGQVKKLLDLGVDYIFYPTILTDQSLFETPEKEEPTSIKERDCYYCYYSVYGPTILENLPTENCSGKLISPLLKFNTRRIEDVAEEVAASLKSIFHEDQKTLVNHFLEALNQFRQLRKNWLNSGKQLLEQKADTFKLLILGRPYVVFDQTLNAGLLKKIEKMGYPLLYQSIFDLRQIDRKGLPQYLSKIHWFHAQQILLALELVKEHKDIYPVFLTCFRCSPDAYVLSYFKDRMEAIGKPFLIIQLDEHSSDVGYQTRIESGIDAFKNHFAQTTASETSIENDISPKKRLRKDQTLWFPEFNQVLNELFKISFDAHGYKAETMTVSKSALNEGYRYSSGGECMPNVAIVGSLLETLRTPNFDVEKNVFQCFTSCVACNFPQFTTLMHLAAKKAGFPSIQTYTNNLALSDPDFPFFLNLDFDASKLITGVLNKLYYKFMAREKNKGDARKALDKSLAIIHKHMKENNGFLNRSKQLLSGILFKIITQFELPATARSNKSLKKLLRIAHPCKHLLLALREVRSLFEKIPIDKQKRPRIAIIGDLYLKWNTLANQQICDLIDELGGEIIMTSFSEYSAMILFGDISLGLQSKALLRQQELFERSFEEVFSGMIDEHFEPSIEECQKLTREYGLKHMITGEVEINVGRVLYMIKNNLADAFLNLSPLFCCPGSVSASIFRKVQNDFHVPIVDIFYDGTNKPNKIIVPHMHFLNKYQQ